MFGFLKSIFAGREVPGRKRVVPTDRVPAYVLDELRAAVPEVEIDEVRAGPCARKSWKYEYDLDCRADEEFIGVEVEVNAEKDELYELEINYELDEVKRQLAGEQTIPVSEAPSDVVARAADQVGLMLEGFAPTECQKGTCAEGAMYRFRGETNGWKAKVKLLETGKALEMQKKRLPE